MGRHHIIPMHVVASYSGILLQHVASRLLQIQYNNILTYQNQLIFMKRQTGTDLKIIDYILFQVKVEAMFDDQLCCLITCRKLTQLFYKLMSSYIFYICTLSSSFFFFKVQTTNKITRKRPSMDLKVIKISNFNNQCNTL